jgi:hypothetical protein
MSGNAFFLNLDDFSKLDEVSVRRLTPSNYLAIVEEDFPPIKGKC